ncbi:MAG: 1-deoxy-D-xylulose-5-phosphate reductoisomerase [Dehalococcoidales bacterium]|nr:1-deoxy-D-xylulose-5-phosphate reductoisomerase [Dehalococcoidales bacterium]
MDVSNSLCKRVAVLGSTGSIGRQALDIARALPDKIKITGLAAGDNLALLEEQISEFNPELVYYRDRSNGLKASGFRLASMEEIAAHPDVDIVIVATAGKAGLDPVLAAIQANKRIALSNKEPLVMAGEIILERMKQSQAWILPVDSEHSAIWQCLAGESLKPARLILTASGGPFLRYTAGQMAGISVEQALDHPSWRMGKKITIDSATLMNKGLEVIEAHWLFDMPYEKIDILVHPQSIVHSMVELVDGSIKAQLSCPDMRLPIQFAISYPDRFPNTTLPKLDWKQVGSLVFEQPDFNVFPCLKLAVEAGKKGGTYPAALCAADEVAVDLFLNKKIPFTGISVLIEQVLGKHRSIDHPRLEEILAADAWACEQALSLSGGII